MASARVGASTMSAHGEEVRRLGSHRHWRPGAWVGGASGRLGRRRFSCRCIGGGLVKARRASTSTAARAATRASISTSSAGDVDVSTANRSGRVDVHELERRLQRHRDNDCTVTLSVGSNVEVKANFDRPSRQGTQTLDVTVTGDSSGGGNVSGNDIDCDVGETNCSDVESVELDAHAASRRPDAGYIFGGWGKDCSGTSEELRRDDERRPLRSARRSASRA